MRSVCIQFQPDRVAAEESRVRQAFREALPEAVVVVGEAAGRFENIMFEAASTADATSRVRVVLDSPEVGRAARSSCIVTCEGERGWDDYLLLHHYDRTLVLDSAAAEPQRVMQPKAALDYAGAKPRQTQRLSFEAKTLIGFALLVLVIVGIALWEIAPMLFWPP